MTKEQLLKELTRIKDELRGASNPPPVMSVAEYELYRKFLVLNRILFLTVNHACDELDSIINTLESEELK